jgi:hypothetical protein
MPKRHSEERLPPQVAVVSRGPGYQDDAAGNCERI